MELTPTANGLRADEDGQRVAEITWHDRGATRIVDHTWVHPRLRGRGVADRLMRAAREGAVADGKELGATCSYAVAWLGAHAG